ncbi:uncharacterized protein LOC127282331 [Leptopilina boulardi]|uniref:uncharacterized protein LOC127282331 n=1 Tax=Leptopilina boulardi TaxID=63433 RepID=UPI0021F56B77|nr:uncharacterized protein LOC127282331 [Leptopilina boulardi]
MGSEYEGTPTTSQTNADTLDHELYGRGQRGRKPLLPWTPTAPEENGPPLKVKKTMPAKQATIDADKEAAKQFNKKVKEGIAKITEETDVICLERALNNANPGVVVKVVERKPPKYAIVTATSTQCNIQYNNSNFPLDDGVGVIPRDEVAGIDSNETISALRVENEQLKIRLEAAEAVINELKVKCNKLTAENIQTKAHLQYVENKKDTLLLQQMGGVFRAELAPINENVETLLHRQNNPDAAAAEAFGDPNSMVMFAGVKINNEKLAKAKSALSLTSRVTFLAQGYWLPEQIPFVGSRKPQNVSDEDFIPVTLTDINNIKRILCSLQEDNTLTIKDGSETKLNDDKFIREHILQAIKNLRRPPKTK